MRKMLFVIFTDDDCKLNHAFLYANDLKKKGHEIKIILEGVATKAALKLEGSGNDYFKKLFHEAKEHKMISGACEKASTGCQTQNPEVKNAMKKNTISMLNGLNGHASISEYMEMDYELVIF